MSVLQSCGQLEGWRYVRSRQGEAAVRFPGRRGGDGRRGSAAFAANLSADPPAPSLGRPRVQSPRVSLRDGKRNALPLPPTGFLCIA
jgi:hypothetical protein